ncbi:hypothetical protein GIR22_10635 [Pseudomonas sp. CCM 7891]|uniref:Uncharacterized protein n=1 Tax=Pseudomonas karstica TaxID=1055468 RepID=A0A7X2RT83_9PSED|nr:hypothetical protein [Pseudomonas karstica]
MDQGSTYRSSKAIGEKPADIWGEFYQTREGNCVTVSAIKAAMMKFGQSPVGIYREIQTADQGYRVTTRDGAVVTVTHEELRVAAERSGFQGGDAGQLKDANFLYAVSAKRAQMENHEGAWDSFDAGMQSLNNGEGPGAAFKRLGLFGHIRHATMQDLANGAIGTLAYDGHSVAVIDGHEERYGAKGLPPPLHRKLVAEYQAIKLI